MKVAWNIEKDIAIPVANIKELRIKTIDDWAVEAKEKWPGGRYYVVASYAICTGANTIVFSADTKDECIRFVEKL